jgi:hypothetical protein
MHRALLAQGVGVGDEPVAAVGLAEVSGALMVKAGFEVLLPGDRQRQRQPYRGRAMPEQQMPQQPVAVAVKIPIRVPSICPARVWKVKWMVNSGGLSEYSSMPRRGDSHWPLSTLCLATGA